MPHVVMVDGSFHCMDAPRVRFGARKYAKEPCYALCAGQNPLAPAAGQPGRGARGMNASTTATGWLPGRGPEGAGRRSLGRATPG